MIQALIHSIIPFIDIAALVVLIGVSSCLLYLAQPSGGQTEYPRAFLYRVKRLIVFCLLMLISSTVFGLFGRSMEMSGLGFVASLPLLPTVVFKTHYGSMWLLRVTGLTVAWVALIAGRRHIGSRFFGSVLFFAGAALAFSRSASGHPADSGDLSPQQLADWLHLLAVSSWGGALLAISGIFSSTLQEDDSLLQPLVAGIADRYYRLFGPILSVLVLTGLYNAWFQIGSFQALLTTPYGGLFSAKVLLLLFLAFRSITPPEHGKDEALFVMKFLHRTRLEAVVILALLLCVALLVHQIPARHQLHLEHTGAHRDVHRPQPVVVLETDPVRVTAGTPVAMTVSIMDPDGRPFQGLAVSHERILHAVIIGRDLNFFAHIHPEDVATVTADMVKKARLPLHFTFTKAGEYLIGIDFSTEDEFYSRTFTLHVASDPGMGKPKIDFSTKKNFGAYQVTLTITPKNVRTGEDTTLRYVIKKDGKAVTNLEPYLGAAMHLAAVPSDLTRFIHTHGSIPGEAHNHHDHIHAAPPPERFGPEVDSDIVFPVKGVYKIFSQVKHGGKVLLFDFMVTVQ